MFFFLFLTKSTLNRVSLHSQLSTRDPRPHVRVAPFGDPSIVLRLEIASGEFAIAYQGSLLAFAKNHSGSDENGCGKSLW